MAPSTRAVLVTLTLVLALTPLVAVRPGLPPTLKADEPAYYAMAQSLVQDGDLRCERQDLERLIREFPYLPIQNLILMSPDGWQTVFFGKPYLLSLLSAPWVAAFGVNGMVSFNALLLAAMIALGALYLRQFNSEATATLFSALFFLLSTGFAYVFWLHPEILNMFGITACLYLAFTPGDAAPPRSRWQRLRQALFGAATRPAWSGAALALAVYNKPNAAALALPALYLFWRRRGWRGATAWIAGAAVAMALAAGVAVGLTGEPSAYFGMARAGVKVESPELYQEELAKLRVLQGETSGTANSWYWILRPPDFDARELLENSIYFWIGRHTGLIPYLPLAVLALALFLLWGRRSAARWLTVAGVAAVALHFLIWIPINWHGGGGFVGNRYFVMAYPAFLFLVTRIRPSWSLPAAAGAASLLLGSVLLTPYGAPVPSPTLQAHARSALLSRLPLELTIRSRVPGYLYHPYAKVGLLARKDLISSSGENKVWLQGGTPVDLLLISERLLGELLFEVRSPLPDNHIVLETAADREELVFQDAQRPRDRHRTIDIDPGPPDRRTWAKPVRFRPGKWLYVYRLRVRTEMGEARKDPAGSPLAPFFFLGAELAYLGTREQNERQEHYRVEWLEARFPEQAAAGGSFEVPVRLVNRSQSAWHPDGPMPVRLSYRWLDQTGRSLGADGRRTPLPGPLEPDQELEIGLRVDAPEAPGSYSLSLDVVRESVAWFSARGAQVPSAPVEIVAGPPEAAGEAPPGP